MDESESLELAVSMARLAVDSVALATRAVKAEALRGFRENFADTLTDLGVHNQFQHHAAMCAFEVQVEMLVPGFEFD